jgi:uncharacterized protein YacL
MNNAEKTEQWQAQAKRDGVSIPDVMLAYTEMIDSHDAGALSAGMVYTFFSDTCDRKIFHALQPIRLVFDRLHQYNMLFRVLPLVIAFVFVAVFRILNITPDTMYARAVIIFPLLMVVLATYTLSAMVKRQWSTLVQIEQHIKNLLNSAGAGDLPDNQRDIIIKLHQELSQTIAGIIIFPWVRKTLYRRLEHSGLVSEESPAKQPPAVTAP